LGCWLCASNCEVRFDGPVELFFWPDEDGERDMCAAGPDPSRMLKVHELTERLPSKLPRANDLQLTNIPCILITPRGDC